MSELREAISVLREALHALGQAEVRISDLYWRQAWHLAGTAREDEPAQLGATRVRLQTLAEVRERGQLLLHTLEELAEVFGERAALMALNESEYREYARRAAAAIVADELAHRTGSAPAARMPPPSIADCYADRSTFPANGVKLD